MVPAEAWVVATAQVLSMVQELLPSEAVRSGSVNLGNLGCACALKLRMLSQVQIDSSVVTLSQPQW